MALRIEKLRQDLLDATKSGRHLDLGAGHNPRNPLRMESLAAVDIIQADYPGFRQVSVGSELPFATNSFACTSAFDFLEHIPRVSSNDGPTATFVKYMQEIHRVLEPDGLFIALTPAFPRLSAFSDPTHVNFITRDTHTYFSGDHFATELGYGFSGSFSIVHVGWVLPTHRLFEKHPENNNFRQAVRRFASTFRYLAVSALRVRDPRTHLLWVFRKNV
jgi:SAM-dependent methyltransferase